MITIQRESGSVEDIKSYPISQPETVVALFASDIDLQYIRSTFSGVPLTTHDSVLWTDHWARFVAHNLR